MAFSQKRQQPKQNFVFPTAGRQALYRRKGEENKKSYNPNPAERISEWSCSRTGTSKQNCAQPRNKKRVRKFDSAAESSPRENLSTASTPFRYRSKTACSSIFAEDCVSIGFAAIIFYFLFPIRVSHEVSTACLPRTLDSHIVFCNPFQVELQVGAVCSLQDTGSRRDTHRQIPCLPAFPVFSNQVPDEGRMNHSVL